MNGWTPERRLKQSQSIHRWKPWESSTGARTPKGKVITSKNAFKGGLRATLAKVSAFLKDQKELINKGTNKTLP